MKNLCNNFYFAYYLVDEKIRKEKYANAHKIKITFE